jgi:hypothetical protein
MPNKPYYSLLVGCIAVSTCLAIGATALAGETTPPAPEEAAGSEPADAAAIKAQEAEQQSIAKDLSPTLRPIYDLGEDESASNRIPVDAWVDRKNLTYRIGDTITLSVSPRKSAYITVLNVGSSGRVAVIYPNHFQRERQVKGGTTVRIPGKNAKWNIKISGPTGVDLIKIIASKKPLTLKELEQLAGANEDNPVLTLGRSAEEMTKDLSPQLKPEAGGADEPSFGVRNILVRVKGSA